ncbi:transcriptional regulator [Nitriliruptoraceae bacterium ZYF776]|nr:transcriptional regulator [Profundirhabdus halotolerans]
MTAGSHPRHELNEVIHTPVRLSVVAALAEADTIDFGFLRDLVEVSDSLLSKHLGVLEDAGYVEVRKGRQGRRPRTWLALTSNGRDAFDRYLATLGRITGGTGTQPT